MVHFRQYHGALLIQYVFLVTVSDTTVTDLRILHGTHALPGTLLRVYRHKVTVD